MDKEISISLTQLSNITDRCITSEESALCTLASTVTKLSIKNSLFESTISRNVDQFFLIINSTIIFFMQCGFAFLEAGLVRSKNCTNILIKNLLDSCCAGISYWIIGYVLAFGSKSDWSGDFFIGRNEKYWLLHDIEPINMSHWFFHFVFAATASTIISGAVAERCEFVAYLIYSFIITGFLYPVITHWIFTDGGWLAVGSGPVNISGYLADGKPFSYMYTAKYKDFAGSGPVHVVGGVAAFIAAAFLGPRIGKFDPETGKANDIKGHSLPLAALGGFILIFGFFAFNGGSQGRISQPGDAEKVATAVVNTVISGSFAAFTGLVTTKFDPFRWRIKDLSNTRWSLLATLNAILAGLVSSCAGCNVVYPWAAAVTGIVAALSYMLWSEIENRLKIDDPLEAVGVHFGGGLWGIYACVIFHKTDGLLYARSLEASALFLGWQTLGLICIILWTALISILTFGGLRLFKLLRVSKEVEERGLDIPKHGEPAYPISAYGHGWSDGINASIKQITNRGREEYGYPREHPHQPDEIGEARS